MKSSSSLVHTKPFGTRTLYSFIDIWSKEGIRGLWRGLVPNLIGVAPARAIHFATYSTVKKNLSQTFGDQSFVHFISAGTAGFTVITATSPIWLVKTRMQLQTNGNANNYKGILDCVQRVFREEGIRGFYKGLVASYVGISETAIQFMLYERFKYATQLWKHNQRYYKEEEVKAIPLTWYEYLTVASIAKLIASSMTYPHEVVRTRMREQRGGPGQSQKYTGFVQCLRVIAREEGARGLYGGMGAHLLRVVPNAAIMFFTYESVVRLLS